MIRGASKQLIVPRLAGRVTLKTLVARTPTPPPASATSLQTALSHSTSAVLRQEAKATMSSTTAAAAAAATSSAPPIPDNNASTSMLAPSPHTALAAEHEQAAKRPRLDPVDQNTAHARPERPKEDTQTCAETGDVPLPTHSSEDLDEVRRILRETTTPKSTARMPFQKGLFLAPMVRCGALPTRLLSLQYGADLVWSPEIVDRAIIGCERTVNPRTGLIAYSRDGKHILTTHPIERERLIFQLGSSSPEWAYKAIKFVTAHDEMAGVDLNCGCPKPFSTIGGMGAQLLSTPDLLCDILRAMRVAAPPHISVTCKIRLLPTKEATQSLVRKIIETGCIDALTVHCRTKDMRPREKALPSRLSEVKEVVDEMTKGALPLICNGDAWDYAEAQRLMQTTGVSAVMIARGAEGNMSCFSPRGHESIPDVIAPAWCRLALALENQHGNTKYCIQSLALRPSSSIVPGAPPLRPREPGAGGQWHKAKLTELRMKISQVKTTDGMAQLFGVDPDMARTAHIDEVLKDVRAALDVKHADSIAKATCGVAQGALEGEATFPQG